MTFNKNNWSVSEAIKRRVQVEDLERWGKSGERGFTGLLGTVLPQIKPSVGLANVYKGIIKFTMEFRP